MSAITSKLARFGAILFFPMLGCMADASDLANDDVELDEQSEALSYPGPCRPLFPIETPPGPNGLRPPPRPVPPPCDPCALVKCAEGTHCESTPVCVGPLCPMPRAQCVPDERPDPDAPFCGGIAGFRCPGLGECVDNPYDNCDPKNGGADCGGLCVCEANANCAPGFTWDGSADVCDCVRGEWPGPQPL